MVSDFRFLQYAFQDPSGAADLGKYLSLSESQITKLYDIIHKIFTSSPEKDVDQWPPSVGVDDEWIQWCETIGAWKAIPYIRECVYDPCFITKV
jgi:hypothetical protein